MDELSRHLSHGDNLVLQRLRVEGEAWIVGGWVRQVLLGNSLSDLDIATTLTPDEVKMLFPRSIPIGEDYGTVIVRLEKEIDGQWEVTTLRKEGTYGDGRRPDNVLFGNEIEEDLARRDFTINAMAIDKNWEIIDIFGGKEDLHQNILRSVGDANERIAEDGLRIMRAFRFLDGDNGIVRSLDKDLELAIIRNKKMLDNVSNERIGDEIKKILSKNNSSEILNKMEETGVLANIFNDLVIELVNTSEKNSLVTLARILKNNDCNGNQLSNQLRDILKFSRKELDIISFLHDNKSVIFDNDLKSLRRFSVYLSDEQKDAILDYHNPSEFIESYNGMKNTVKNRNPLIDGTMLVEITNIEPGPKLGMLKGWLFRQQIEKNLTDKKDILKLLDDIDWEKEDYKSWPILSWP
jgi:tRNA nucleotidyltransferase (CCA-adding enzyme)|tara:strand:- start:844 stop:2067 length:1224 start_codon:yes stop_codon:yes gene_type:complete